MHKHDKGGLVPGLIVPVLLTESCRGGMGGKNDSAWILTIDWKLYQWAGCMD